MIERGRRESLVLTKLNASITERRSPGPGAIKKVDWEPIAQKYLRNRKIVLHTDRAKSYTSKVQDMVHDSVRHCKKRVKVHGRWVWKNPVYVRLTKHKLPDGRVEALPDLGCPVGTATVSIF